MYLSRIMIDRRNPSIRQGLKNCEDMHRNIMRLFSEGREQAGVLYRLKITESECAIYILSKEKPQAYENQSGFKQIDSKDITLFLDSIEKGQIYTFDLITVPAKKITQKNGGNSKRHILIQVEERFEWLRKKAVSNGFEILMVNELNKETKTGTHGKEKGGRMYLNGYHYMGKLLVTDADKFRKAYEAGIGAEKAYGFGMLLISR